MPKPKSLLNRKLKIINIGIGTFVEDLKKQGVEVVHTQWQPPAEEDRKLLELLEELE